MTRAGAERVVTQPPHHPHPLFFEPNRDQVIPAVVTIVVKRKRLTDTRWTSIATVPAESLMEEQQLRPIGGGGLYLQVAKDGAGQFSGQVEVLLEGPALPFPGDIGPASLAVPEPPAGPPAAPVGVVQAVAIGASLVAAITPLVQLAMNASEAREKREEARDAARRAADAAQAAATAAAHRDMLAELAKRPAEAAASPTTLVAQLKEMFTVVDAIRPPNAGPVPESWWDGAAKFAEAAGPALEPAFNTIAKRMNFGGEPGPPAPPPPPIPPLDPPAVH